MIAFKSCLKKSNIFKFYKKMFTNISYTNVKGYKYLNFSLFPKKIMKKRVKKRIWKKYHSKLYRLHLKRKKYSSKFHRLNLKQKKYGLKSHKSNLKWKKYSSKLYKLNLRQNKYSSKLYRLHLRQKKYNSKIRRRAKKLKITRKKYKSKKRNIIIRQIMGKQYNKRLRKIKSLFNINKVQHYNKNIILKKKIKRIFLRKKKKRFKINFKRKKIKIKKKRGIQIGRKKKLRIQKDRKKKLRIQIRRIKRRHIRIHKRKLQYFKRYRKYGRNNKVYQKRKRCSFTFFYKRKMKKTNILQKTTSKTLFTNIITVDIPFLYVKPLKRLKKSTNRGFTKPRSFNFSLRKETIKQIYKDINKLFKDNNKYHKNILNIAKKTKTLKKLLRVNKKLAFISQNVIHKKNQQKSLFEKKESKNIINNAYLYFIKRIIWNIINTKIRQIYLKLKKLKVILGNREFLKHFKKIYYLIIYRFKITIISLIGLKKALKRKRKEKRRYITDIPLKIQDLKTKYILTLALMPHFISLYKPINKPISNINNYWVEKLNNLRKLKLKLKKKGIINSRALNTTATIKRFKRSFNQIKRQANNFYKNYYDLTFKPIKSPSKFEKKIYQTTFKENSEFDENAVIVLKQEKKRLKKDNNMIYPFIKNLKHILNLPRHVRF